VHRILLVPYRYHQRFLLMVPMFTG
jgi:hypothetical protein